VSAGEIIREIERLSSEEKAEVLSALLRSQPNKSKLSPDQLVALADQMVAAKDPADADRLEAKILAGFYGRWAMSRIKRERIPDALMAHLVRRIRDREISTAQLGLFARWLDTDPEVPWFKRFPELIVCGEGALVKTFLRSGQVRAGEEVN
jgi:hypothetical protein